MKKTIFICILFFTSFLANAQCTISPFIQQNYEVDAKRLAFREIQSDPNDPNYNDLFVSDARVIPYLEQLSAIYQNPNNNPSIDSLFNEFQFRVNPARNQPIYEQLQFIVNTNVSWVQALKDTGVSGYAPLDDLMNQYQLSYEYHYDNSNNTTYFILDTSYDVLNFRVILPDFQAISDITYASASEEFPILGPQYTGVPYLISYGPLFGGAYAEFCDVYIDENGVYRFWLGGGYDCFNGCPYREIRYVTVSDDCSQVNFSRTLSTEDSEISSFAIYPNPTSDKINIQGIRNIKTIEIFSILGKKIEISTTNLTTVDVRSLKNGIYFLKVIDDQNRSAIRKFIKK